MLQNHDYFTEKVTYMSSINYGLNCQNVYNIKWREEEEHCFRRFHTAKVLMNKFLLIFFLSQLSPFIKFLNENMLPKKYAVFWPPSSFVKKKVSWKLFIKDKQQFYKISNSSLYQKGISVLMTMKQVTGKASGTILWYSSEIKNQLD